MLEFLAEYWLVVLLAIHAAARVVVAFTPSPKDDEWVAKAYKIIEVLALTFGKAKQLPGEKK